MWCSVVCCVLCGLGQCLDQVVDEVVYFWCEVVVVGVDCMDVDGWYFLIGKNVLQLVIGQCIVNQEIWLQDDVQVGDCCVVQYIVVVGVDVVVDGYVDFVVWVVQLLGIVVVLVVVIQVLVIGQVFWLLWVVIGGQVGW